MRIRTQISTMRRLAALIAACLTCLFCGCSIFELKDPAGPSQELVTDDPLHIVDILRIVAPEVTASIDYKDYFADNVEFENQYRKYYGNEVIRMLENLRSQAVIVEWGTVSVDWVDLRLRNVPYTVYRNGERICAGFAEFQIVQEHGYTIKYWKDNTTYGPPFFEPW